MIKYVKFLNTKIHALTMEQTLEEIENFIMTGKPHQHVCVNALKVVLLQKNPALREAVNSSDIISADGVPIVWASRFLGKPLPGRVNGTDLMYNLVKLSAQKGYRVFFFGAGEEIVTKTVKNFQLQYPALKVAGYRNGYFSKDEEMSIALQIKESNAQILFIAISTPIKELYLNKYKDFMNVPFIMGVGGSFDIVAEKTKRAPQWMQRHGLEWFYRIIQEPKRMWKRYLITNPKFVYYVLRAKFLGHG